MSDETRTLARRYVEFFNSDALGAVRDVVAVDYVLHGAAGAALDRAARRPSSSGSRPKGDGRACMRILRKPCLGTLLRTPRC